MVKSRSTPLDHNPKENHKKDSASYLKWQKFEKYVMGKQEKGFDILSEIEIHLFLYYVRKSLTYVNQ